MPYKYDVTKGDGLDSFQIPYEEFEIDDATQPGGKRIIPAGVNEFVFDAKKFDAGKKTSASKIWKSLESQAKRQLVITRTFVESK